jgi:hypothetical protein
MTTNGDLGPAIRLFHHRWSVPITYVLRDGPRSQAQLQRRLGASPTLCRDHRQPNEGVIDAPVGRRAGPSPLP